MPRKPGRVPEYKPDIYSVEAIVDPHPHYQRLRDLGSVVWLAKHKAYALPRYSQCKAVLRDDTTFLSGTGVALNRITNRLSRGTTLNSDGAEHDQRRKRVAHRMLPRALRAISDRVEATAAAVVDAALDKGDIDGVNDLAARPAPGRGPRRVVRERTVLDGSMADELLAAADRGELSHRECPPLMVDYLAPSIDTTMSAISNALYLFATHPEQWHLLKNEPALMPNAITEVVRYEPPLRAFARHVGRNTEIDGVRISSGSRVLVMYASANRDERDGNTHTSSTSAVTPGVRSASARVRTRAPVKPSRAWKPPPCYRRSPSASSASRSPLHRHGRSTTSSTAMSA
jgi:cytochrome P450